MQNFWGGLLAGAAIGGIFFLIRRRSGESQGLQLLQNQIASLSQQLNERMKETSSTLQNTQTSVGQRLDNAAAVVGQLERKLGQLEESSKRIYALGEGLQELRDILKSPKLRGNMGEFFLEDLLRQILPPEHFRVQHTFRSGEVVDALIELGAGKVCVDSKFPLESFVRLTQLPESDSDGRKRERRAFVTAIKRHADSIAKKYIVPDEGTFDFALMYIPAENVYYETMVKQESEDDLYSYLLSKRVIPVSPSSLYAYLQVIVLGLRGMKVEQHARELAQNLQRLSGELERFGTEYNVLGRHIRNAAGSYDEGGKRLEKFQTRLSTLAETREANALPEKTLHEQQNL
ncbi:MAG TPA: DNA recombination protein RmuC [Bdellovibrionota bacterium]|jgi:DNA recombination protein RmuC